MTRAPGILATPDQDLVETRALKVLRSAAFQEQVERTRARYAADEAASVPGGQRMLDRAVEELAWAAALIGVNADPTHPAVAWVYNAPHALNGRAVPGSRWGIDNPDNVYRIAPVDGASRYEVFVRRHGPAPVQFSYMLYSHFVCEDGHEKDVDTPIGVLRSDQVQWTAGDSFTFTIDASPANGRANHIQSTAEAKQLLIRNTLSDWNRELPLTTTIKRIDGPPAAPSIDDATCASRSAFYLGALTSLSLNWKKKSLFGHWLDNMLCTPYGRGGAWGFAASGNFNLDADEALVVTVDPLDAAYLGFMLCDLWLASLDHVDQSSSLNQAQTQANGDGTYTYVIAGRDPGFVNWLDTGGLQQGSMLYRWQALPRADISAERAVKSVRRIQLRELHAALPTDARFVTPGERAEMLSRRAREYARRYLPRD